MSFPVSRTRGVKVLLVNPRFERSYWGAEYAQEYLGTKAAFPPLALLTLAALLPQHWEFRVVDENARSLTDADIEWADYVFITGMLVQKASIKSTLEWCELVGRPTVVGGPFASNSPDAPELKRATSLFIGEFEVAEVSSRFVQDVEAGTLEQRYDATALERPELSDNPIPRFDLIRTGDYAAISLQNSRGCKFRCEFCDIWKWLGNKMRALKPQGIIAQLQALHNQGYRRNIFIVDDNFLANLEVAEQLLLAIIEWHKQFKRIPFNYYTEADILLGLDSPRMARIRDLMREAGFNRVFIGIESGSEEALRETKKNHNVAINIADAVSRIRASGIRVMAGFIVGFDADDETSFDKMIRFIQEELKVSAAMPGVLIALPGTDLETRLKQEGRMTEVCTGDQFGVPNFLTKMPRRTVTIGYRRVLNELYGDRHRVFDTGRAEVAELQLGPRRKVTRMELMAVLRMIWKQGIVAPYRMDFWRFMYQVARDDWRKIPEACDIAIRSAHDYRFTREDVNPKLDAAIAMLPEKDPEPTPPERSGLDEGPTMRVLPRAG